ncbi:hypothetical protein [Serratia marcescens]|uniref:hypothetical protein n=1 Tax=Serratia marcescens TaxID=615 RepID=UPI0019822801|nr:hypothetical protein [Serratia marcescens]MBN3976454.1 hypothetical protein [Serratia marcescens]
MTTIEMIKNLAQRNSVVASADVLAVFAELEAKSQRITGLERHVKDIEATLIAATDEVADLTKERDEARAKLATPVRLPALLDAPSEYASSILWAERDTHNATVIKFADAIRAAGFKVEGDE